MRIAVALAALVLVALVLVALAACGSNGSAPLPDAPAALPLETLVEVTVEAECARLQAKKPAGARDEHLKDALEARRLSRAEYDEAARLHPEALRLVDNRLASCRTAAGYQGRPLDGGVVWEKLPP